MAKADYDQAKTLKSGKNDVVPVGKPKRVSKLQALFRAIFPGKKKLARRVHPNGTAPNHKDDELKNLTPLSVGIHVQHNLMSVMTPRNTPTPGKKEGTFVTCRDNQERISVKVYEGERARASDNVFLGQFTLDGIPAAPRGVGKISVHFDVEANGTLHVSATEPTTGRTKRMTVWNAGKLSKAQVSRMVQEAEKHRKEDDVFVRAMEAKRSLDWYVYYLLKDVIVCKAEGDYDGEKMEKLENGIDMAVKCLDDKELPEKSYVDMENMLRNLDFINVKIMA